MTAEAGARRSRRLALWGLVFLACLSCNFGRDMKAIVTLQSRIQADIGVASNVNFRTVNGVTTVNIVLATLPPGDPKITKAKVEALAHAEFPHATTIVVLATL